MSAAPVSVVVPAYNSAAYLAEAIYSVRAQKWPNIEIIVVDDGSTDGTQQILDELADDDLIVLTQPNSGPGAARNRGIEAARGEWIAFLDADDAWMPDKLNKHFEQMTRHVDVKFSYSDSVLEYSDSSLWRHRPTVSGPLFLSLLAGNPLCTPTLVVRRECFSKVGLFDRVLSTGEDWDMWLRLAAHFDSAYIPLPLAKIRMRTNASKHSAADLERCTLRILKRIFSSSDTPRKWLVSGMRRELMAWHYSVLAKSSLRQLRLSAFLRLAIQAVWSHPIALWHLLRRNARPYLLEPSSLSNSKTPTNMVTP